MKKSSQHTQLAKRIYAAATETTTTTTTTLGKRSNRQYSNNTRTYTRQEVIQPLRVNGHGHTPRCQRRERNYNNYNNKYQ